MNKWINPVPRIRPEESPGLEESRFDPFHGLNRKKLSRKSIKERIADKSVSLAERLGYETTK
jgi:hypothetical protein